jgi:anti-sigma regulatory factor (Ser/Thr protein kinase)
VQARPGHPFRRVASELEERLEVTLGVGGDAPARALMALRGLNSSLADLRHPVRLLVSELVTNVVQQAGAGPEKAVCVRLDARVERVRVEVSDEGPEFEPSTSVREEPLAPGSGLTLVDELADRWGVSAGTRSHVWFEIDRKGA